ncbi:hypothetical protein F5884DRAFT_874865 [Xylogone sp. PMI_703]|nr:hypothetical protein F5884DRAFT_874865 [Xylogone sp. PMI_703]
MAAITFISSEHSDLSTDQFLPPFSELATAIGGGILAHTVITLAIAITGIEQEVMRLLIALLNAAICAFAIGHIDRSKIYGGQMTVYMVCQIMQGNWALLLSPIDIDPSLSLQMRLRKALYVALDPRPSSRRPISQLPTPTTLPKEDSEKTDSHNDKFTFIFRKLTKVLWTSVIYYIIAHHFRFNVQLPDFDKAGEHSLLYRHTHFDLNFLLSCVYIEALGDFQQYWIIEFVHGWCAIFAVLFLGHDPADWTPLWGDIRDAYTMARFYTYWWHKILRKQLIENSRFLLNCIVFLPKSIRNSRYAVIMAVFLFSAIMHGMAFSSVPRCLDNRVVTYFTLLAPTVVMEEMVQQIYGRYFRDALIPRNEAELEKSNITALSREHNTKMNRTTSRWRYAGYCWVILYKCWVVPRSLSRSKICF